MDPLKDEGPSLAGERPSGIEDLPRRVERYGTAKARALDVAEHIAKAPRGPWSGVKQLRLSQCGDYLLFRHYLEADSVRLHAAQFCKYHLLCPLCAIRRGAKALEAYLPRYEVILGEKPHLRPLLVTLTVKDGANLGERFRHLRGAVQRLNRRRGRGRGVSCWERVAGAVWSYEVKRGKGSGLWHPHAHAFVLADGPVDQTRLRDEWQQITGDSFIVDVRPIVGEAVDGFCEVFKYAVKFSDMEVADTVAAATVLRGERLISSCGVFRGVEIPDELEDDPLEGPYVELFYRYLAGRGYSVVGTKTGESRPRPPSRVDWSYYWQQMRR
jgi:hypothetical protein